MSPLILDKEHWYREHRGLELLDSKRLTEIQERCKAAQARLAAGNESIPHSEELRMLVYEDIPALVRKLESAS
jgi:hypothetical protein